MRAYGPSDDDLIVQIVRQRPDALAALYDRYARLVYSLALYVVADSGLAEEIVQDVFLQVWQRAAGYNSALGKVNTWLTSITRHRAIDMLRRRKVRPEGSWTGLDQLAQQPGGPQVESEVLEHSRKSNVIQALAELPESQRQALSLAYFYGLTQQEIAEQLDEPLGTVKTRIRLGMQKLRNLLGEEALDLAGESSAGGRPEEANASKTGRNA